MKKTLLALIILATCKLNAQFCFAPAVNYPTNSDAWGICKADFNTDGHMDVAVTNRANSQVSVFFGDGAGALTLNQNINCGNSPEGIAAGDFNNDGKTDLVVANNGNNVITILDNMGTGTFSVASQWAVSTGPKRVVCFDFNSDGFKDIAVTCQSVSTIDVLLNSGTGMFPGAVSCNTAPSPVGLCGGDFNNDGKIDLASANNGGSNISVILGNGDGTFQPNNNYGFGGGTSGYFAISSNDVNNDGNVDLLVGCTGSNHVCVSFGSGNGVYTGAAVLPGNSGPRAIDVADFNADGTKDLAVALYGSNEVGVYQGVGGVSFNPPANYNVGGGPRDLVVADLNEDGRWDIVTANLTGSNISVLINTMPTIAISANNPICIGATTTLTASGADTYTWTTGPNTNTLSVSPVSTNTYSVLGNTASCPGITDTATIVIVVNALPTVMANANPTAVCPGNPVTLTGGGAQTYTWSSGVTNGVSFPAPSSPTTYSVWGTDGNGCINSATVTVAAAIPTTPSICQTTVDSLSVNNVILWDKTLIPTADTVFIYRDTANNNYALIARIPYAALSQYTDTARSIGAVNGDPNITTYRYKMAYKDTCGAMSAMSPYHNTIYNYNISSLFLWNQYEIQFQPSPVPGLSNYVLKRDNVGQTGNYVTAATAGASSTSINDPQYGTYQTQADWRVETIWNITCTPTARQTNGVMGTVVKSKSNIINNRTTQIQKILDQLIAVYPNPTDGNFNLRFNSNVTGKVTIKVFSPLGNEISSSLMVNPQGEYPINLNGYPDGIYMLQLVTDAGTATKRIIKN